MKKQKTLYKVCVACRNDKPEECKKTFVTGVKGQKTITYICPTYAETLKKTVEKLITS